MMWKIKIADHKRHASYKKTVGYIQHLEDCHFKACLVDQLLDFQLIQELYRI